MIRKYVALSALLVATTAAFAQAHELRGTVTDAMCGRKHMMKGASAAECTRACVKSGSEYALASGDKIYILRGDKAQIDKFAGADVVVKGDLSGSMFTVKEIAPAH